MNQRNEIIMNELDSVVVDRIVGDLVDAIDEYITNIIEKENNNKAKEDSKKYNIYVMKKLYSILNAQCKFITKHSEKLEDMEINILLQNIQKCFKKLTSEGARDESDN